MGERSPTEADALEARRLALTGLVEDRDVGVVAGQLASLHPRNNTFPAEVLIELSADLLDVAGVGSDRPLELEGAVSSVFGGLRLRGREQQRLQTVLLLGPALRAGVRTDLLNLTYWWDSDDLYRYAWWALAAHARAAADGAGVAVSELCAQVAARHGLEL